MYLSVKDIGQLYTKMSHQTSRYGSAIMDDLWQTQKSDGTGPVTIYVAKQDFRMFMLLTFNMCLLSRIMERPFLNARAPSNRISNKYTFFLVAI